MLNGEERFVVKSISRNDIAAMMNDVIDEKQLAIPLFGEGDDRLTSRICGVVVGALSNLYEGDLSEEDLGWCERHTIHQIIVRNFC